METPTPSRENLAEAWAASATPPMHESAITHLTGSPLACTRFADRKSAVARAIPMVGSTSASRTPLRRPSIAGRMPILGMSPIKRLLGWFTGNSASLMVLLLDLGYLLFGLTCLIGVEVTHFDLAME